jgi:RimJ/RimL family protein N-acetyltransferase
VTARLRPLTDAPAEILTERLRLVVSDVAFAPRFADAMRASHDDLAFTQGWREVADPEVAALSLRRSLELADRDVVRHAFRRDTGAYVARVDLHSFDAEVPRCELGYVGASEQTGTGLVTEACRAMLALAWDLGVVRVQALCDARNGPSIRLAERIGLQREGLLRSYERDDDGQLCDQVVLAIVRP